MLESNDLELKEIGALVFLLKMITCCKEMRTTILNLGFVHKLTVLLEIDNTELRKDVALCLVDLSATSSASVETMLRLNTHKKVLSLLNTNDSECLENVSPVTN